MPVVTESIYIARPPQAVHEFMIDPENATLWQSNLIEYEQLTEGPVGKGTKNRGITRVAGKKVEWETEIAEYEAGASALIRSTKAPMEFTIHQSYQATGDGTTMTWHQEVGSLGGFFGKLGDALVTRMYHRDVKSNLEKLKELLEA